MALPAKAVEDGLKFVVRITIGTRGLDLLLDIGASGIVLDRDVVKSLGIVEYDAYSTSANAGRYVGTRAIVPVMSIGPLTMHDVEVDTIPHVDDDSHAYKVVGLLGFDVLDQIGVKIDYQNGKVTAYQPSAFVPPTAVHTIALDVRLGGFAPDTDVTVNGVVGKHFTLDTGGAGALVITDDFRRRHPDAVADEHHTTDRQQLLAGVGGDFDANVCELANVQIGNAHFDDIDALVLTSPALYSDGGDGTIGPDVLRAFTVDLDYQHHRIYMTPNDLGSDNIRW